MATAWVPLLPRRQADHDSELAVRLLLISALLDFYAAAPYLPGAALYPLLAMACCAWWWGMLKVWNE